MRYVKILWLLILMPMLASAQVVYDKVKLDFDKIEDEFGITIHQADTPTVRAFLYVDGNRFQPTTNWSGQLGFGTNEQYSTSLVFVDGVVNTETNFIDFAFSAAECNTNGDFFCQILLTNSVTSGRYVFGDGGITIKRSPISGSANPMLLVDLPNGSTNAQMTYYSTNTGDWFVFNPGPDGSQLTISNGIPAWNEAVTNILTNLVEGTMIDISGVGRERTITHEDTSPLADIDNSNGTVIQDMSFDSRGHSTSSVSYDLDNRYYTETEADANFFPKGSGETVSNDLDILEASYGITSNNLNTVSNDLDILEVDYLTTSNALDILEDSYAQTSNHLNTVSNDLDILEASYGVTSNNLNTVSNDLDGLEFDYAITSNHVNTVSNDLDTLELNVTTISNDLDTLEASYGETSNHVNTISNDLDILEVDYLTTSNALDVLEASYAVTSNNLNTVSNDLDTLEANVTTVSNDLDTLEASYGITSNHVNTISNDLDELEYDFGIFSNAIPDSSLSTNIALLNRSDQQWSGSNTHAYAARDNSTNAFADNEYITYFKTIDLLEAFSIQSLFGATNAHPDTDLAAFSSLLDVNPVAETLITNALSVGTNYLGTFIYTNYVNEIIPVGAYRGHWHEYYTGNGNPFVQSYYELIATDGTTTNILGTSAKANSSEGVMDVVEAYVHMSTNTIFTTNYYLGVSYYGVRLGGAGANLIIGLGSETDSHLSTPSLGGVGAGDMRKAVYDTDDSGSVDTSEGLNSTGVAIAGSYQATSNSYTNYFLGAVGIGTNNPAVKLHITGGAIRVDGGIDVTGNNISNATSISHGNGYGFNMSNGVFNSFTNFIPINLADLYLQYTEGTISTPRLYWDADPRLAGSWRVTEDFTVGTNLTVSNSFAQIDAASTNYFLGNVGIGTNNPQVKLHVNGKTILEDDFEITESDDPSKTAGNFNATSSGGLFQLYGNDNVGILLDGRVSQVSYINNGGNVGIGTNNPLANCHTIGTNRVDGVFNVDGTDGLTFNKIWIDGNGITQQLNFAGGILTNSYTNSVTDVP